MPCCASRVRKDSNSDSDREEPYRQVSGNNQPRTNAEVSRAASAIESGRPKQPLTSGVNRAASSLAPQSRMTEAPERDKIDLKKKASQKVKEEKSEKKKKKEASKKSKKQAAEEAEKDVENNGKAIDNVSENGSRVGSKGRPSRLLSLAAEDFESSPEPQRKTNSIQPNDCPEKRKVRFVFSF